MYADKELKAGTTSPPQASSSPGTDTALHPAWRPRDERATCQSSDFRESLWVTVPAASWEQAAGPGRRQQVRGPSKGERGGTRKAVAGAWRSGRSGEPAVPRLGRELCVHEGAPLTWATRCGPARCPVPLLHVVPVWGPSRPAPARLSASPLKSPRATPETPSDGQLIRTRDKAGAREAPLGSRAGPLPSGRPPGLCDHGGGSTSPGGAASRLRKGVCSVARVSPWPLPPSRVPAGT